jgi:hypothetical protein
MFYFCSITLFLFCSFLLSAVYEGIPLPRSQKRPENPYFSDFPAFFIFILSPAHAAGPPKHMCKNAAIFALAFAFI